ncbi:fascin domain-containing protein [Polyangium mundeleinium]|uniref:DUF7910 domain-containing protein n=1 Tax=Polyangium mundeleinium TaxID=2995306 RepID=A0ABT5F1I0_9BACT|nr:hypothetical protein [Polyangium mundeleinium]MDC0747950.1 hypothetical protein [Polyangium mundeleinium]
MIAQRRVWRKRALQRPSGRRLDLFAPGSGITSAYHTGDSDTASKNGTSMASPHVDNNGGSLESGDFISLQASNGRYMVAEDGGGSTLEANRTSPGAWETFRIWKIGGSGVIHSGDSIALQSSNGKYVAAENGGGGEVNANRSSIGPWETLKVSFVGW